MPFERKQDAIGYAQRTEDAPSGKQPDVAGGKRRIGRLAKGFVVKNITVEHLPILATPGLFGCDIIPRVTG